MTKIRVSLVDDEKFYTDALGELISGFDDLDIVEVCHNAFEALDLLSKVTIDVMLTDIRMPRIDGAELIRNGITIQPSTRFIALTSFNDDFAMAEVLSSGASGFLLKSSRPEEISSAIRGALHGETHVSPKSITLLRRHLTPLPQLSVDGIPPRDLEVLYLLAQGRDNATIGMELGMSISAVKKSVSRLMHQLEADSRLELATMYLRSGM